MRDGESHRDPEFAAHNGLLHRRSFLRGAVVAGAAGIGGSAGAETLTVPDWTGTPGRRLDGYGQPSRYEAGIQRGPIPAPNPLYLSGPGSARTPLHLLEGTITPSGLFFERSHNGVPDIDPAAHRLVIHGLVKRSLSFTIEALSRYPMATRTYFIECAGNSAALAAKNPVDGNLQQLHGLVSCSEWTGVPLSVLLDEAGIDPRAKWLLAEGADAAAMSRSVPLDKAMDDVIIALYQNGERLRPSNGYPARLLVPGFQGNLNVKWLRRLQLTSGPMMTKDETSKYSLLLADGKVAQFKLQMDAKAIITRPSPGHLMKGPGLYEITGLAWSGLGKIASVEVSADGGRTWARAALTEPVLSRSFTRFRIPWRWDGSPAVLQARAVDETGYVQPTRDQWIAARGTNSLYHNNAITSWRVSADGVSHVYG